jgi:hypothetical protein
MTYVPMDRFQTFTVISSHQTGVIGCGEYLRMAQEISLVISVGSFGLVVGFLSGYSIRAYLSHQRRRRETLRGSMSITPV